VLQPDQDVRTELNRWFLTFAGNVAITAGVLLVLAQRPRMLIVGLAGPMRVSVTTRTDAAAAVVLRVTLGSSPQGFARHGGWTEAPSIHRVLHIQRVKSHQTSTPRAFISVLLGLAPPVILNIPNTTKSWRPPEVLSFWLRFVGRLWSSAPRGRSITGICGDMGVARSRAG
jgi:hypothetical protein